MQAKNPGSAALLCGDCSFGDPAFIQLILPVFRDFGKLGEDGGDFFARQVFSGKGMEEDKFIDFFAVGKGPRYGAGGSRYI